MAEIQSQALVSWMLKTADFEVAAVFSNLKDSLI